MFEFIYATILNGGQFARFVTFLLIIILIGAVICSSIMAESNDSNDKDVANGMSKISQWCAFFLIFFLPVALVPSPKKLLEVRLGLIGWDIATSENVQKTGDELKRLMEKLECKYLGCDKEDKK